MKNLTTYYSTNKQGYLPLFLSDCLDLLDPVLTFDRSVRIFLIFSFAFGKLCGLNLVIKKLAVDLVK